MKRHEFDGSHWDPRKIRAARELGWIRQIEAQRVEEARRRRGGTTESGPDEPARDERKTE